MRKAMVELTHPQLSVRKQCALLDVNRNRLTSPAPKISDEDQRIMELLDRIHTAAPCFGSRRMRAVLRRDHGMHVGRRRVARLMRLAGIRPSYPRPRTSMPGKGHKVYPYLLRDIAVTEPDQVWCSDITYIPLGRGFCYLAAVMDWHTREVLGWAVSATMDVRLCLDALEMAFASGRRPGIFNTDQGSQYTCREWIARLECEGIRISMDGKGRWVDNVRIERPWRSVKYEDVYLRSYESPRAVALGLRTWFKRYNNYRPHSALNYTTPRAFCTEAAA